MDSTTLVVYLGIPMPSIELVGKPDQKDRSRTVLYAALDDLCHCSNKLDFRLGRSLVKPEFKLLEEQGHERSCAMAFFRKSISKNARS
jgi:hypothetical protein